MSEDGHQDELRRRKKALRQIMRDRRRAFAVLHPGAGAALADLLMNHHALPERATVAAYMAFRDEIDPTDLVAKLRTRGYDLALPRVIAAGQPLNFHAWMDGAQLMPGPMGMREPDPATPIVAPDVVLVPLLAFDANRYRLGYGGGYYDRTLPALKARQSALAVGLAYSCQQVEAVPHNGHDAVLDVIVTERGLI